MNSAPQGRRKLLRYAIPGIAAAAIAVAGFFALDSQATVPDATFTLLSGQKISTATDLKGQVYLVNFWATSCSTCMHEMPEMVQTYDRFKNRGLRFVAVAMNYDTPAYVANYARSHQLPFMVAIDNGSAAQSFGNIQLTPTTFVVDRQGHILMRYVGEPSFDELDHLLQHALGA